MLLIEREKERSGVIRKRTSLGRIIEGTAALSVKLLMIGVSGTRKRRTGAARGVCNVERRIIHHIWTWLSQLESKMLYSMHEYIEYM